MAKTLKRFGPGDRVYVRAQQIWVILVAKIMANHGAPFTITYRDLAVLLGMSPKAAITLARQLGILATICEASELPAINLIVVGQNGEPGSGVLLREGRTLKTEQKEVMCENWFSVRVPTIGQLRTAWEAME